MAGRQLVVCTEVLTENVTLPVALQLPPLLLPLLSIICRCCNNIPRQGDYNNCVIHAMFQRPVNFWSGTIKGRNTVPGFSQALKCDFFSFFLGVLFHKDSEIHPIFTALFLSWAVLWVFVRQTCRDPQRIWKWGKVLWAKRNGHSQAQGAWILDVISGLFLCNPLPIHY